MFGAESTPAALRVLMRNTKPGYAISSSVLRSLHWALFPDVKGFSPRCFLTRELRGLDLDVERIQRQDAATPHEDRGFGLVVGHVCEALSAAQTRDG
jgi:hypothetical protein